MVRRALADFFWNRILDARLGLDSDVDVRSRLEFDLIAVSIYQAVHDANLAVKVIRPFN